MDKEGNEIKFWSSEFLVKKYLHLSDSDISLNEKMKQEEIERLNLAGGEGGDEEDAGWESLKAEDKQMLFEVYQEMKKKKKEKKKPDSDSDEKPKKEKEEEEEE